MRVYAIVLDPEKQKPEKIEVLETTFIPEPNTVIILKTGDSLIKTIVVKTENVLEKVGESADLIFNIFVKPLPPEQDVN